MNPSRRTFMKQGLGAAVVAAGISALPDSGLSQATMPALMLEPLASTRQGDMLFRPLGRTNEKISVIGFGGAHIGGMDGAAATRLVRTAVDRGITFMDNCWDYSNGQAEANMGNALADGYRQKVFLMTKFDGRTKVAAMKQIDESLARLKTDHIDLIQIHENIHADDPDRVFAPGGAIEAMVAAKQAGKVRYFGFTGHKDPAMHLNMINKAVANGFHFDSVQMPLNLLDAHYKSFAREVIPAAMREGIGILAMKTMAAGAIFTGTNITGVECLQYALTLPTATVITGLESLERIEQATNTVKDFKPLSREQVAALMDRTKTAAADGALERFKTSTVFDGTTRNPAWMG